MKKIIPLIIISLIMITCSKNPTDSSINFFSVEDDKLLGKQVDSTIMASPSEYPVLPEASYPNQYAYLRKIRDKILGSGQVFYKDEFVWEVKIIKDDNTLNAFCTPGGYIYIYTGLMKFLDSEDELAGVLGHEMAHADRRHSTDQLTKIYGIQLLLDVVLGRNPGQLAEIAAGLASLSFSRSNEREADDYSVIYLCPTDYNAAGAAEFFLKLEQLNQSGNPPEFLSTHPNPENRISDIQAKEQALGCTGNQTYDAEYQDFLRSLP